jgi:hypothetical protein
LSDFIHEKHKHKRSEGGEHVRDVINFIEEVCSDEFLILMDES